MIVAHRGASADAPENTVPAFELAWKQGADAIEGDFRLTKDGHIVCIHDPDTKRTAGKKRVVAKSTLEELRALGSGIPTLGEVLATVPAGKSIYLEIKCGAEIIPPLLETLGSSPIDASEVLAISFDQDVLKELKARAPQYATSWLCRFETDAFGNLRPTVASVLDTLEEIKADGLGAGKDYINEAIAAAILAKGFAFHVWTVDAPEQARQLLDWGATSITTNTPGKMKSALAD
ncbi:glycerophosphodiester phosphodiesterase [Pontiella sp.]|uniref:glycerophosphodiester phosphodiesterase n=1 Tax=Pontiella sp. TaxID=2837462 RepID=UPI003569621B